MSFQFDSLHLTHQLTTGIGYPECFGFDKKIIRGSVYLDGPTIIGDEKSFKTVEGSVMIGPCNNTDSPIPRICPQLPLPGGAIVEVCGLPEIFAGPILSGPKGAKIPDTRPGDPYTLVVRAGEHLTRDESTLCSTNGAGPGPVVKTLSDYAALFIGKLDVLGTIRVNGDVVTNGDGVFRGNVVVKRQNDSKGELGVDDDIRLGGTLDAAGEVYSNCRGHKLSAKKDFDIPHPTKEGWRLRHVCIEGPTADVYFRGRVKNQKEISIPEYWKGLVDPSSITVTLTPVGSHQNVIIKRIDEEKIYLQSQGNMPIDCFYHVYGERMDCEKNIPEYEGLTIDDYPGDNGDYNHNNG
jgi:hypothetical protein